MYEEGSTYSFYVSFIPDCIFHVLEKKFVHIHYETFNESTFLVGFKMITWKLDFFSQDSLNIRSPSCKTKMPDSNSNQESEKKQSLKLQNNIESNTYLLFQLLSLNIINKMIIR